MKKRAFTLAEVLITLGIIGVVAALTMPALVASYKKKETITRLKKFYSMMSQAIKLSEAENGDAKTWNYIVNSDADQTYDFFMHYLAPYMKYLKVENKTTVDGAATGEVVDKTHVYLADGSVFYIHGGGCVDLNLDVNGDKPPNKGGVDRFAFLLCPVSDDNCGPGVTFCTYNLYVLKTREQALDFCKNIYGIACSRLLEIDGWEFKDDYPYSW
jgi:prepilin-type N-terminal cleavage/methylation domain-containing protein